MSPLHNSLTPFPAVFSLSCATATCTTLSYNLSSSEIRSPFQDTLSQSGCILMFELLPSQFTSRIVSLLETFQFSRVSSNTTVKRCAPIVGDDGLKPVNAQVGNEAAWYPTRLLAPCLLDLARRAPEGKNLGRVIRDTHVISRERHHLLEVVRSEPALIDASVATPKETSATFDAKRWIER